MRREGKQWKIRKLHCDSGDEAEVCLVLTDFFPGIGGNIHTEYMPHVAIRQEFSYAEGCGKKTYATHAILQKLDDYFRQRRRYLEKHIPNVFGSATIKTEHGLREISCYEWFPGNEGFCWVSAGKDSAKEPVVLEEWGKFVASFIEAGIDLGYDCTVPDGVASKNIIHAMSVPVIDAHGTTRLNCLWRRIDFGSRSIIVDYEKLARFIRDSRGDLISVFGSRGDLIGQDRYNMLCLLVKLLAEGTLNGFDAGQLTLLVKQFRSSTLFDLKAGPIEEDADVAPLCLVEEVA